MTDQKDENAREALERRLQELEQQGRRRSRWTRLALIATCIGALSMPFVAKSLGPVPHTFTAGGVVSASQMNENFAYLQNAITDVEGQVPAGAVMMFNLSTCPAGWSELSEARGRTFVGMNGSAGTLRGEVGTPLDNMGTRTITQVPNHTHGVGTLSGTAGTTGSTHLHSVPALTTGGVSSSSHNHSIALGHGEGTSSVRVQYSRNATLPSGVPSSMNTGSETVPHTHSVPSHNTSTSGSHTHTVTLTGSTSNNTGGVTAVDVTMPYVQLLVCVRD